MSKMPPGHWMRRFGYGTLFLSTFARGGLPNRSSHPGGFNDLTKLIKSFRFQSLPGAAKKIYVSATLTDAEITFPQVVRQELWMLLSANGYEPTTITYGPKRARTKFKVELYEPGYRKRQGRSAKSYNRRVSKCISGKVREGWEQHSAVGACLSMDSDKRLRSDGSYIKGRRVHEIQSAQRYIVYGGYGEPLGILNYGGKYYYSDEPPWETPLDLAEGIYRTKRRSKLRLVSVGSVSDEVFEKAQYNERSGKYRKGMI